MRDIVFQAEEVAQAQGALRRRCSQDARLTGETMPARLRAHPRITGESRTCRSRPLAAGSLCGAAAPREVVIGGELRTPFSLSPQPIPIEHVQHNYKSMCKKHIEALQELHCVLLRTELARSTDLLSSLEKLRRSRVQSGAMGAVKRPSPLRSRV